MDVFLNVSDRWREENERERERYIIVSERSLSLMVCAWIKTDSAFEQKNKKDEVPHAWSRSRRAKVERGQVTPAHRCSLENRSEPTCRDSTAGEYTKLTESARFDPGSRINFDTPAREEWMDLRINTGSWEFIKICFFSSALIILFGKKCTFPKNQSMLFLVDA